MKKYLKTALFVLICILFLLIVLTGRQHPFDALKDHQAELAECVDQHYLSSVFVFAMAFISTAFFIPGVLALTITGGFLFGGFLGTVYATGFLTLGATLAFLLSRYLIGEWIQKRFRSQLASFNEEIGRHGQNYLFVLRVIPVMPFFLVNYLAGITGISRLRFMLVTFFGVCPGAAVYSMIGNQLGTMERAEEMISPRILIGFSLLAVFALLPVLYRRIHRHSRRE